MLSRNLAQGTFPAIEPSRNGHSWLKGYSSKDGGSSRPSLCPSTELVHTCAWSHVCVHVHLWHSQYTTNPLRLWLAGKKGQTLQIPSSRVSGDRNREGFCNMKGTRTPDTVSVSLESSASPAGLGGHAPASAMRPAAFRTLTGPWVPSGSDTPRRGFAARRLSV